MVYIVFEFGGVKLKKILILLLSVSLALGLMGIAYFLYQEKIENTSDELVGIEREPSYYEKDIEFKDDKIYILKLGEKIQIFMKNEDLDNFVGYTLSREKASRNDSSLSSNYDVMRITNAATYEIGSDNRFNKIFDITNDKEWEFAIKEEGTNDFIGGATHGDEILNEFAIEVDNKQMDVNENIMYQESDELIISATSDLYRDSSTTEDLEKVATRDVIYTFNADGLNVSQQIDFVDDMVIERSYLAMLPILRDKNGVQITDTVFDNNDVSDNDFNQTYTELSEASITGEEKNLSATMSIEEKSLESPSIFFVSNSEAYNKLYFTYSEDGHNVSDGDVWSQNTLYDIRINK